MRFTPAQLNKTRLQAEKFERNAMSNARSISRLRKEMREMIVKAHETEWQAAFYEDARPEWSRLKRGHLPSYQWAQEVTIQHIRRYEESMATNVAGALAAKALLDRYERRSEPRREPGLWLLMQLCWKGWRRRSTGAR